MKNDSDPETEIQPEEHSITQEEEWGFPVRKHGLSKEAKLGISFIFVLLVAFGFVLYPKLFPDDSLGVPQDPVIAENAAYGQDAVATVPPNAVSEPSIHSDPFASLGASENKNNTTGTEVNKASNDFLFETPQTEPPLDRPDTDLHPSGIDTAVPENSAQQTTDAFLLPKPSRSPTGQTSKTGPFRQDKVASVDRSGSVAGSNLIRSSFSEETESNSVTSHSKPSGPFLVDATLVTSSAAPNPSRDRVNRKSIETTSTTLVQAKPVPEHTSLSVPEKKDTVTTPRIAEDSFAFAKPRPGANSGHTKNESSKHASHSHPNIAKNRKPSEPHPKTSDPFDAPPHQTTHNHKTDRVPERSADMPTDLSSPPIAKIAQKKPKIKSATSKASKPSDAGKAAQSKRTDQQKKANDGRLGDFQPVERQQATSRTVVRQPAETKATAIRRQTAAKTRSATLPTVTASAPAQSTQKSRQPENHKGNNAARKPSTKATDASKPTPSSDTLPPLQSAKKLPPVSTPPSHQSLPLLPNPTRKTIGDVAIRSQVTMRPSDLADTQPAKSTYVVKESDSFWTISKNVYGTARFFQALALYNKSKIPDPQRMRPGTRISTPSPKVLISSFPKLFPGRLSSAASSNPGSKPAPRNESPGFFIGDDGQPSFRVGAKDTLTDIAHRHLGRSSRWIQIYQLNRDRLENPHNLPIGKVLRLPSDASRIQFVQKPHNAR